MDNGKYTIYNENCFTAMENMINQGIKVDAVICDPPYNIDYGNSEQDRAKARGKVIENRSKQ